MKKILLILLLSFSLRLIKINQSFWLDEAAQIIESLRPLNEQFNLAVDFHPPLFHLILHFWLKLGSGEIFVRLLPVILGTGSVYLLYKIAENLFNKKTASLAALFLATSPYHIWYSQEVRPYMLFLFFSLLSTLFLIKKKWLYYFVSCTLLFYANYFSVFVLIGQIAFYISNRKNKIKPFILSLAISMALFLPWLPSLWQQIIIGKGTAFAGWTSVVSVTPFKLIPLTLAKFLIGKANFDNLWLYSAILLPGFIVFTASIITYIRKKLRIDVLLLLFIPALAAFFVSVFFPIAAPQRLIFLLPFFYLVLAAGIEKSAKFSAWLFTALILLTSITGTLLYYINPEFQRENWRQAIAEVELENNDNDLVLFAFPDPFAPYQFYAAKPYQGKGIADKFIFSKEDARNLSNVLNNTSKTANVYYFAYLSQLTDPHNLILKTLENRGYVRGHIKNYPGVGFIYVYGKSAD